MANAAEKSGCYTLSLGLESLSQASLNEINKSQNDPTDYLRIIKRIRKAGIDADTEQSLFDTVKFIKESGIIAPKFYIYTPIPVTDLYNEKKANDRLTEEDVFKYKPSKAVIKHPNIATNRITEIYDKLYTIKSIFYLVVNMFYRQ